MYKKRARTDSFRLRLFPLLSKGALRGGDETGEGLGIMDGDLREHLAVDGDVRFLEAVHEDGVGDIVDAASGIDSLDPELTIVPLDEATGDVSVAEGVEDLLLRGFE